MAGTVEAIGSRVVNVKEGDKVAVWAIDRCGACSSCRRGYACENLWFNPRVKNPKDRWVPRGSPHTNSQKRYMVYKLAPDTDLLEASLTEPLYCVLRSVNKANVVAGDSVVIVGGGVMGLLHVMVARRSAAQQVIVSEPHPQRRARFPALWRCRSHRSRRRRFCRTGQVADQRTAARMSLSSRRVICLPCKTRSARWQKAGA